MATLNLPTVIKGINDVNINCIWRCASIGYPLAKNPDIKESLKDIILTLDRLKPTYSDFRALGTKRIQQWYDTLIECDNIVSLNVRPILCLAQTFLEKFLVDAV